MCVCLCVCSSNWFKSEFVAVAVVFRSVVVTQYILGSLILYLRQWLCTQRVPIYSIQLYTKWDKSFISIFIFLSLFLISEVTFASACIMINSQRCIIVSIWWCTICWLRTIVCLQILRWWRLLLRCGTSFTQITMI